MKTNVTLLVALVGCLVSLPARSAEKPNILFILTDVEARRYVTHLFTDAAIEFIENSGERPWFCYVPFNAPHSP